MAAYEGDEPATKFCEILHVGRKENGLEIRPHDVTIFYKFKSGRGDFKVQGGIKFDESTVRYSGQRKLTIVATKGYSFGIARSPGGGKGNWTFTTSKDKVWGEMKRVYLED